MGLIYECGSGMRKENQWQKRDPLKCLPFTNFCEPLLVNNFTTNAIAFMLQLPTDKISGVFLHQHAATLQSFT